MTTQQKTVAIVVPAAEGDGTTLQELTIIPGTRTQDVLNSLERGTGFILGALDGTIFRPNDLIFDRIDEDGKLVLTPAAEAGAFAPAPLVKGWRKLLGQPAPIPRGPNHGQISMATGGSTRVLAATATPSRLVAPGRTVAVKPNIQPPWKEKGWREVSPGVYEGHYRSPLGSFRGRVEFGRLGGFQRMYIWNPPRQVQSHAKAPCFSDEGRGRYQVHMLRLPVSVDSAILCVEKILNESYVPRQSRRGY